MKLLLLFLAFALTARAEINTEAFLEALAMKETGMGWNGEPGPCGELSKWQIMPSAWRDEMGDEPFARARDGDRARVCVLRRIARFRARVGDNPERIATCWHYGPRHRSSASVWGQEVANLYESLK